MFNRFFAFILFSLFFFVISCSRPPYYQSNKSYKKQAKQYAKTIEQQPAVFTVDESTSPVWTGTTNFNMRKPNYVIIHHTAQNSCEQTFKTFTLPRSQVSAHYVICKDGTVHHMLNDYLRSWHAGVGKWGNLTDVNSASIGIEIDNNGFETFTNPQVNSLLQLLDTLKRKYTIPAANFIGHGDIAPTRKVDPNIYFPWKALADQGFGLWYSDTTNVIVQENFNSVNALRIIGYDVKDSTAAIKAFKRHFMQDTTAIITDADKKILVDLMNKSM
ncbi:MAG: N-acetylmuramoyl-L-alanine amidase [Segetibacter sp.]|nr:N-acetylmuramoyl-L-alanine amidase [Segetibacter sp.]